MFKYLRLQKTLDLVVLIILLTATSFSVGSILFERWSFFAHLLVNFQLQYWIIILFSSITLLFKRHFLVVSLSCLYLIIIFTQLLNPILVKSSFPELADIIFLNSQYDNNDISPIIDTIRQTKAPVVAFVESNKALVDQTGDFLNKKPIIDHRSYASSCTIFSLLEPNSYSVSGKNHLPICVINYESYDLIIIHPHRPASSAHLAENLDFLNTVSDILKQHTQQNRPFILVGDFNLSQYSSYFREYFGSYNHYDYFSWNINSPIALPIDHVISNIPLTVSRSSTTSSDHAALFITLPDEFR